MSYLKIKQQILWDGSWLMDGGLMWPRPVSWDYVPVLGSGLFEGGFSFFDAFVTPFVDLVMGLMDVC